MLLLWKPYIEAYLRGVHGTRDERVLPGFPTKNISFHFLTLHHLGPLSQRTSQKDDQQQQKQTQ
jgi:hypothetical protein